MYKIPFFISNLISCFIYGSKNRQKWRGRINTLLFRPFVIRFVKKTYGVRVKSVRFIRQITLNRMVCVVNDRYFVKVFRNVTIQQLKDFEFLSEYVERRMKVTVPHVIVHNKIPMYVCERVAGKSITDFDKKYVADNYDKILKQAHGVIRQLQRIKVDDIPNKERFMYSLQRRTVEQPCRKPKQVLAHFDLNMLNFLFDDELNICSVIDWDTLSIANNPTTDTTIFLKYWNRYKSKLK
jgi:aminoglycoside phosphotransferase (APT) family kinase protein